MPKRERMRRFRRYLSSSIEGYRCQLQGAINRCRDGASIELDLHSAEHINEILRQVVRTCPHCHSRRVEPITSWRVFCRDCDLERDEGGATNDPSA